MADVPSIVIKTRDLLSLRGYMTDAFINYADYYKMLPVRQHGTLTEKLVVWIFKAPKVIGVATIKEIMDEMEEVGAHQGMLVGGSRFTPAAKKLARHVKIELVEGTYSSFDLFSHELVPKHVIASDEEVNMLLGHYGIKKSQLPRILRDDPAAKLLGAKPGQVIRIERKSPTAGKSIYYRLVVEGSR